MPKISCLIDLEITADSLIHSAYQGKQNQVRELSLENNKEVYREKPVTKISDIEKEDWFSNKNFINKNINLTFDERANVIQSSLENISLDGAGDEILVEYNGANELTDIFIRDESIAKWDSESHSIIALSDGRTEVYFVSNGVMKIIPIVINNHINQKAVSQNLNNLKQNKSSSIGHASFNKKYIEEKATNSSKQEANPREVKTYQKKISGLSLSKVDIQIVDDRTIPNGKKSYPVSSVQVYVVGTNFVESTNRQGYVKNVELPINSRVIVKIKDPKRIYVDTHYDFFVRDLDAQKIQIRVIRRLLLKSIQTVAKYPKDNNTSSLCAYLKSYKKEDLSMFKVELDSSPNSTLYYNAYGYLDPFLKSFSNNSRFCIF